jgi:hypothetical protein
MTAGRWRALAVGVLLTMALVAAGTSRVQAEAAVPVPAASAGGMGTDGCRAVVAAIEEQNRKLSQELRQIKRELAALNQNLERPGVREIMAGIGYILGLFGMAALVASRRDKASRSN